MKPLYFFPEYSSIQACDPLVPRKKAAISRLDAIVSKNYSFNTMDDERRTGEK